MAGDLTNFFNGSKWTGDKSPGRVTAEEFLNWFDYICEDKKWETDAQKLSRIRLYLDGNALNFATNLTFESYEDFCEKLKYWYDPRTPWEYGQKARNLKKLPGQTDEDFVLEALSLLRKSDIEESKWRNILISHVQESLNTRVRDINHKTPWEILKFIVQENVVYSNPETSNSSASNALCKITNSQPKSQNKQQSCDPDSIVAKFEAVINKLQVKRRRRRKRRRYVQTGITGNNRTGHCDSYVNAQVGNRAARILLDTGATCSLVSFEFLNRLKTYKVEPVPKDYSVTETSGGRLRIIGIVKLPVSFLNEKPSTFEFLVFKASQGFDVILGSDFLNRKRATISYKEKALLLEIKNREHSISFIEHHQKHSKVYSFVHHAHALKLVSPLENSRQQLLHQRRQLNPRRKIRPA